MDGQNDNDTLLGILAYLGPLVIVSYLMAKEDAFLKFHVKQGFVLLAAEVIVWVLGMFMWPFWIIRNLINLVVFVFAIIGIVNVINKKEQKLPLVGDLADKIHI